MNILTEVLINCFMVVFISLKVIFKFFYKTKKFWYKLSIFLLIANGVIPLLTNTVYAPKPIYAEYVKPTTQREQIINYIISVFGKDSDNAIAIAQCESHLNPLALNNNESWGGVGKDYGIFQLNDKYQRITNVNFLYDWKSNIDMAYVIFKDAGYHWNEWSCARYLGIN